MKRLRHVEDPTIRVSLAYLEHLEAVAEAAKACVGSGAEKYYYNKLVQTLERAQ